MKGPMAISLRTDTEEIKGIEEAFYPQAMGSYECVYNNLSMELSQTGHLIALCKLHWNYVEGAEKSIVVTK